MFSTEIIDNLVEKGIRSIRIPAEPENLYTPISYTIGLGGKHLRPRLCLTSYNLFDDNITDEIIYPAVALEIFHQFTLLHDDLMDNSPTRRGRPTVFAKWGTDAAVLCGDAMFLMAYKYLFLSPAGALKGVADLFNDTAEKVLVGQQLDIDFETMPVVTMDEYINMISLKTGALIAGAAKMGALLAGAPESACDALWDFGMKTGIAFQITDDYLDTFGDASIFGKPIGGDIVMNKKTWLLVEALHRARTDNNRKTQLEHLLKMDSDPQEKISEVRRLYVELGLQEGAREAILKYHEEALEALSRAGIGEEGMERMQSLAEGLIHREK